MFQATIKTVKPDDLKQRGQLLSNKDETIICAYVTPNDSVKVDVLSNEFCGYTLKHESPSVIGRVWKYDINHFTIFRGELILEQ